MFESRKKLLLITAIILGACSFILLVLSVLQLHGLQQFNQAIKSDDIKQAVSGNHLMSKFTAAWHNHQTGRYDDALDAYREIESEGSPAFQQIIRYNQADLYLQMASVAERKGEQDITTPLVELAKHKYRELLRENSQNWQVKYNLEAALKLLPDLDPAEFPDDVMPERSPEATGSVEIDRELP